MQTTLRRGNAQSIGDLLADYLRDTGLDKPLYERELIRLWPTVVSPMAARLTKKIEIRDGVLYAYIHSSALKQQLFELRFSILKQLNEAVGATVIHDIRLLG